MATNDSARLSFRSRSLVTRHASCRQVVPVEKAPNGQVASTVHVDVNRVPDAKDMFYLVMTLKVIGHAVDNPSAISFEADCTIGFEIRYQGELIQDELPKLVVRSAVIPPYVTAAERCKHMIWEMGYLGVTLNLAPPELELVTAGGAGPSQLTRKRTKSAKTRVSAKK